MDKEEKLKTELKKTIKVTLVAASIISFSIYKIITFPTSTLFGDLGAIHYYIAAFICILILYIFWLAYAIEYAQTKTYKKLRMLPAIILASIGIAFFIIWIGSTIVATQG